MYVHIINFVSLYSNYGHLKKGLKFARKIPLEHAWPLICKIDPFQNQYLSTSLERPYKKLLNACFSFEIRHSELKL